MNINSDINTNYYNEVDTDIIKNNSNNLKYEDFNQESYNNIETYDLTNTIIEFKNDIK